MALAEQVHQSMLTKLKLKNYGLFYDNLAVCRPPQFLAILTEPAFIMYPEEEMLLTDPKFQWKCANAIANGIEKFLKNVKNN
jgi:N-acetylmuramoyl-L-alanine amidase